MNLNGHAALSGDYNDRTWLKTVKIECFVKRIQCQCFFILSVPPTPSLATGYTDNPLSTPVSHIKPDEQNLNEGGFAPIFPDTCYHLTHYWPAAVDIPVASDNPVHYADAIRYNARTPLQGSLLPLTRLVWA